MSAFDDAFDKASKAFDREVRALAADYVQRGLYAPWQAVEKAREEIMSQRRAKNGLPP